MVLTFPNSEQSLHRGIARTPAELVRYERW